MGKQWKLTDFLFFDSKITADGDCSHEIKRFLLHGRKAMANLDSILKSRDITLSTKVCLVKAMVFPVVRYGCVSWTIKKAQCRRTDALYWTLESPLDCKEIKPVNPKGNQSWIFIGRIDAEAEAPPNSKNWFIWKDPDAGKDWRQEEKGPTEDEMVGWRHRLDGRELGQTPGVGDGEGSLACCGPSGHRVGTWLSNWAYLELSLLSQHTGARSRGPQQLQHMGSVAAAPQLWAQAQRLWCTDCIALWRVGSSQTWGWTRVSCTGSWVLHWATGEVPKSKFWPHTCCWPCREAALSHAVGGNINWHKLYRRCICEN